MRRDSTPLRSTRVGAGGFTILELLIVVGVIVILVGIIVGAGSRLIGAQREKLTQSTLDAVDRAMEEFIAVKGGIPRFPEDQDDLDDLYEDVPGDNPGGAFEQFADPYGDGIDYPARPDASVFLNQARGIDSVSAIVEAIPDQFLVTTLDDPTMLPADEVERNKEQPSIIDAWGTPTWNDEPRQGVQQFVYYVHPGNRLAQDIYGRCVNRRPYFVSAGPDKLYGHPSELDLIRGEYGLDDADDLRADALRRARQDNIYSYGVDTDFRTPDDVIDALN